MRIRDLDTPILRNKQYEEPSLFLPENLLREAMRQKNIQSASVPKVVVLDPDGDLLRHLIATKRAVFNQRWPCYHTQLYDFTHKEMSFGIIACAVGASFAVLLAEELFASGCELLISISSAGQLLHSDEELPIFLLIERALRDEGTSYHYLPPSDYACISSDLLIILEGAFADLPVSVHRGSAWTTDAPFRETEAAMERARSEGIRAVEMESAALYSFAAARHKPVICFAYITNRMGMGADDFEKGEDNGSGDMLELLSATAHAWFRAAPQGIPRQGAAEGHCYQVKDI
jgi:uridine phosphorylase